MKTIARALIAVCLLSGPAAAAEFDLERPIAWTALGAMGRDHGVAIGEALQKAADVNITVTTAPTDEARAEQLRSGEVDFSATAVGGSIAAQEGVFGFAAKEWGPQKVRLVLVNNAPTMNYAIAVADDLGIEGYADLKGKRVAWYTNVPVVNVNTAAYLAYGGLSWSDVEKVEIAGFFDEALGRLADGELDAAFASTNAPSAYAAADGPRGLLWPELDPKDIEAFDRLEAVAPYFVPHDAATGAGIDAHGDHEGAHYPYPILVALEQTDHGLVYNMTKAIVELYPQYQGKADGIDGWKLDTKKLLWFVPYHDGAVAYFTEMGVWTDAAQAHNDQLVARQETLAAAWQALKAEAPQNWQEAWAERRRKALEDAGLPVVF